jgi:hypothetical protein
MSALPTSGPNPTGFGQNLIDTASGYYLGKEAEEAARAAGQRGYDLLSNVAMDVEGKAEFKPFTVASTTGGRAVTDPTGGFTMTLSPEEQALQSQLFGGAGSMFGQAITDPRQAQAALYEDIRAVQRPEEERKRLALEERMLSQGRMGLQSAAYGGSSPELLAQAQAEQEAMLKANLGAREQIMGEQKQAFDIGTGMFSDAYKPQGEMLDALDVGRNIATLPQGLQNTFMGLYSKLGQSGVEALLQGEEMASGYEAQMTKDLINNIFGTGASTADGLWASLGGGDAPTPQWIKDLGNKYLPEWLGGSGSSAPVIDEAYGVDGRDLMPEYGDTDYSNYA